MPEALIVEAVRTPIGKRNGSLAEVHPVDLSAHVLRALVERTGIDPSVVDDVVWGCVNQVGDQGSQVGRYAVLAAGWPESVPGVTINRACGSSQSSFDFAAGMVMSGQYDVVVAGGRRVDDPGATGLRPRPRPAVRSAGAGALRRGPAERRVPERRLQPGDRRRAHRRGLGLLPADAGRVRDPLARADRRRHRRRCLRRPAGPGPGGARPHRRRGAAPRHDARDAGEAQAVLQARRGGPRRELVADLRRRVGGPAHVRRACGRAGRHPDRPLPHRRGGRRRPAEDADRADPGDPEGAQAVRDRPRPTSASTRSTRRSPRCRWPGRPSSRPTWTG